jgi:hypothetical protein
MNFSSCLVSTLVKRDLSVEFLESTVDGTHQQVLHRELNRRVRLIQHPDHDDCSFL